MRGHGYRWSRNLAARIMGTIYRMKVRTTWRSVFFRSPPWRVMRFIAQRALPTAIARKRTGWQRIRSVSDAMIGFSCGRWKPVLSSPQRATRAQTGECNAAISATCLDFPQIVGRGFDPPDQLLEVEFCAWRPGIILPLACGPPRSLQMHA